jgi:hypothetical protein
MEGSRWKPGWRGKPWRGVSENPRFGCIALVDVIGGIDVLTELVGQITQISMKEKLSITGR